MNQLESFLPYFLAASEEAAIACYAWIGRGDKIAADDAAVIAMRHKLNHSPINARIVIGEGELDEAPMLFINEELGQDKNALKIDIAVDPLEGTNLCAHGYPGAMTAIAYAQAGNIFHCPDVYMDKLVVSPKYAHLTDIDDAPETILNKIAKAKDCAMENLRVIILNRSRHQAKIDIIRAAKAKVILVEDGDIATVLSVLSGVNDIYMGSGGAPEGVLAAAAIAAYNGDLSVRLILRNEEEKEKARKCGIIDFDKKYNLKDLIKGEVYYLSTGVTSGDILKGVKVNEDSIETETLIISSKQKTIAKIKTIRLR